MTNFPQLSDCQFKFLIVDDDPLILLSIKEIISKQNLECLTAKDGNDAIVKLAQSAFDIVITDIKMPNKNGFQLLQFIKERYPEIDVIIITAFGMEYSLLDALSAGAIDYILKPFSPDELLAKLNRVARERTLFNKLMTELIQRKQAETEKDKLIVELTNALAEVKTLQGIIPICAHCKKIRDDKGYWNQIEAYIRDHSEAEFSHCICPKCAKELYPDINFG